MKVEDTKRTHSPDDITKRPFPRSYWVVPGMLCAGEYPGTRMRRSWRRSSQLCSTAGSVAW